MKENHASLLVIYCNSLINLFIVYSVREIDLHWTYQGGVFSLNSEEISVNLLAVISVHWNEKAAHYSSVTIFYFTTIAEGICHLLKRSWSPGRPVGSQKLGSRTSYFHLQLSEIAKQFHQQYVIVMKLTVSFLVDF